MVCLPAGQRLEAMWGALLFLGIGSSIWRLSLKSISLSKSFKTKQRIEFSGQHGSGRDEGTPVSDSHERGQLAHPFSEPLHPPASPDVYLVTLLFIAKISLAGSPHSGLVRSAPSSSCSYRVPCRGPGHPGTGQLALSAAVLLPRPSPLGSPPGGLLWPT